MTRIVIALMVMLPLQALAGFQVIDDPKEEQPEHVAAAPASAKVQPADRFSLVAVRYFGSPGSEIEVRRGFGRDVTLTEALKQIAPDGWHAFIKGDVLGKVDRNKRVSWRGGRRWTEVLDILASDHDLVIDVDWDKRHLYVSSKEAASTTVVNPKTVWTARAGSTLRDSIQEWAQRAGWQLVWDAEIDYPIVAQISFEGSFTDALVAIFRSYEKAERPLLVDVHQPQRVVYVTARN